MSLEQYDAMVESGIFTERDRLQLINGILVAKVTQGDDHSVADGLCRDDLSAVLPLGWCIRSDKPVRLPPDGRLNRIMAPAHLSSSPPNYISVAICLPYAENAERAMFWHAFVCGDSVPVGDGEFVKKVKPIKLRSPSRLSLRSHQLRVHNWLDR